jgi:adenylate cyclase
MELVVNPGKPDERRLPLRAGVSRIGRESDNEVVVANASLSRHHAVLHVGDGRAVLLDLESRNGSFIGEERVTEQELPPDGRFRCGDVHFELQNAGQPLLTTTSAATALGEISPEDMADLLAAGDGPGVTRALRLRQGGKPGDRAQTKLETLLRVSRILSEPDPLDALLRRVFDLLFLVFDIDRGALLLRESPSAPLTPAVTLTRSGERPARAIYSQRIVERVVHDGVGLLADDATKDARFGDSESVLIDKIRSSMCVPLRGRQEILGALYVDHLSLPGHFAAEDLEFLTSFAHQAAIAVENARLVRQLEDEAVRRSHLLRFFPPSLVGPLMASPDLGREPKDHEVTVLFSDITGFTQMSSVMASREVVRLLNRYFPPMAEIVFRHGGTLEKYIGDALMAIWGAPVTADDDADHAVAAALEMVATLDRLNEEWGLTPPLSVHIGLHSGPVTFGNIGSPEYVQFAAIGDTTNVASRVCSVAQGGEVVISAATRTRLKTARPMEALPPTPVKGKAAPLELYRLVR